MKRSIVVLLGLLTATPAFAQRLPGGVVPEHYTLTFAPDFTNDTFDGDATIAVRMLEPTSRITLNAAELDFKDATVTSGSRNEPATVSLDAEHEAATLTVARPLPAGPATLRIRFVGILNDKLRGFYLSKANNRKYAVTQFEATDARRAFPCFDEPALKATFDVTLTIDRDDTAISNGRLLSDTPGPQPGKHTLKFATSPKMSTYLVAMVVGNFECRDGASDGVPIRICSTPDKKPLTGFALEAAEQQVHFYDEYFGIKYPFGKLDVIAVPDFAAGAMENTAAITFREVLLLADPATASFGARKNIAGVLAHEIAHMWFGDLVTMQWWNDLWLNEGFATWMANKPLQAWKPEWQANLDDAVATQTALNVDSLQSTRPIRASMETPAQISEAFDAIAYQKGAAVLHMAEAFVGPDVFRRGVTAYLKKYSYSNATSDNFWTEISAASNKPLNEIMATFVEQPGAPLLTVEAKCQGTTTSVSLTQQRFYLDPALLASGASTLWKIPVCVKVPGAAGPPTCEVLTAKQQTFKVDGCAPWVFANAGAKGYYRSEYPRAAITAIAATIETALTPAERIGLLEDEWALVRAGKHEIGQYLTLAEGLARDRTAVVMQTLAGRLHYINKYLVNDSTREPYRAWVRRTFAPAIRDIGWEPAPNEAETTRSLRATLLSLEGAVGHDPEVLRRARELAERYIAQPDSLDPTVSAAILQIAAETGDTALYEKVLARLKSSHGPQEYYRFFGALSEFTQPALVDRTLEYALSDAVRTQDAPSLISGLLSEPEARLQTWNFVKSRWSTLERRLGTFQGIPVVVTATQAFCDSDARRDVQQFFDTHKVPAAERAVHQSLESIENCVNLRARQEARLTEWLKQKNGD